jgi:hypothetical protein
MSYENLDPEVVEWVADLIKRDGKALHRLWGTSRKYGIVDNYEPGIPVCIVGGFLVVLGETRKNRVLIHPKAKSLPYLNALAEFTGYVDLGVACWADRTRKAEAIRTLREFAGKIRAEQGTALEGET